LHYGWAIEGAIGSEFKVDVSYLSTHVNMATRLETLSKELDVTIVMSEGLKEELSETIQEKVRAIDRVMLSGFKNPIIIYTLDLHLNAIEAVPPDPVKREADKKLKKFKLRQLRETRKLQKVGNIEIMENVAIVFEADPDVVAMRAKYHTDFYMKFDMGYRNYVSGEWSVARGMLETTSVLLDIEDGPSVQLLSFMEQYSFKVPDTWQGYRHAV